MKVIHNAREEKERGRLKRAMALLEQASEALGDDETYEIATALEGAKRRIDEALEDLDSE